MTSDRAAPSRSVPLIRRVGRRPSSRRPVPAVSRRASRPAAAPVPCEEPRCERPTRRTATGSLYRAACTVRATWCRRVCNGSNPRARCGRTAARGGSRRGYYRSLFLAISRRALVLRAAATSHVRRAPVPPPPLLAAPDPAPTPTVVKGRKMYSAMLYGPERDPKLEGL